MSDTREPKYYGSPNAEGVSALTEADAIEEILDDCDEYPETVIVCGFAPMKIHLGEGEALESILENLDVDYSDPDGDPTEPTQAMKDAEAAFLAVIKDEYVVWAMDEVSRREVNVAEWLKDNEPRPDAGKGE